MQKKDMNAGIYCIINKINGKMYLGSSINLKKRWRNHKDMLRSGCHPNLHLQSAWSAYGEENFEFVVVAYTDPDKAVVLEDNLLKNHFALFEYNIAKDATAPMFGKKHSEESKQKMKAFSGENSPNFGKHPTEETRAKISQALSGENNPNFGKHFSEEHKRKISEAERGKVVSDEFRAKMSKANSGENNPNFGKHLSEEHRRKIGDGNKGYKNPKYIDIPNEKMDEMKTLRAQGHTYQKIADIFGVSEGTVWRRLNKY